MKKPNTNNGVTTVTTSNPPMGLNKRVLEKNRGVNCKIWPIGENGTVGGYTEGLVGKTYPVRGRKFVALNETGTQRIGEDHARARLSDTEVEAMRDAFEAHPIGDPQHVGYKALAKRFGCSKRTARDICNYNKRNQWAARWKRVT